MFGHVFYNVLMSVSGSSAFFILLENLLGDFVIVGACNQSKAELTKC